MEKHTKMTAVNYTRLIPQLTQSHLATKLKKLHDVKANESGTLLMVNVCDVASVGSILKEAEKLQKDNEYQPKRTLQAFATASYGIALETNTTDDEMTWMQNRAKSVEIGEEIYSQCSNLSSQDIIPFSIDVQEGYMDQLDVVIEESILKAGAVGINLEDAIRPQHPSKTSTLMTIEQAVERIQRALNIAKRLGVPDFVINARTDALIVGSTIEEALKRGKAYLDAGATVVFVWGGSQRGVSTNEVKKIVKTLNGKVNFSLKPGGLTLDELSTIGAARASLGPQLLFKQREGGQKLVARSVSNLFLTGKINDED